MKIAVVGAIGAVGLLAVQAPLWSNSVEAADLIYGAPAHYAPPPPPPPAYYAPVPRPAYNYEPALRVDPVYGYGPVERRVYGYGPPLGYVAEVEVEIREPNRALGVYAPRSDQFLPESRAYFRAVTKQSGGN